MTGAYAYTPAIWPPLIAAAFLAVIAQYVWRRRDVPGGKPFVAISVLTILVLLAIALEAAAIAPATVLAWYKFQFVVLVAAVTPVTCFVLDYAYPGRWLTRRNLILLSIPPVICLLMVLINDSQLIWRRLEVGSGGSILVSYAPAGAILLAYAIGMALVYLAVFLWLFIRSPQHRWPVALMLLGQVSSRTVFLLDNAHLPALSGLDLTTFVVVLPWTTYAIAMFGFHILDPLPAARRTVTEQMHAGMVVFDAKWQVVSLNPAAERITGIRAGAARGKTWHQLQAEGRLLPALPADSPQPAEAEMELPDMALGSGTGARHYAPALSTLRDFRGLLMGYLLMLRDVTDQKRAQAQLLAQRWAQAILLEREQLAHELHDGLSQDLAFLNVQAQAAELYLQTGQEETARASVARLAEVSREMAGDVRDLIGNLLVVSLPSEGFCTTLRHVVTRFEKQNGLPVYLDIDDPTEALCGPTLVPPDVGVQLVRIVQEALTNVRRHAGASDYIGVRLRVEAGQMELAITDNGAGFEPDAPGTDGQHFGLQVMRQRAASIGGRLAVHSAPGQGTRVEVCVPLASDEIGSAA